MSRAIENWIARLEQEAARASETAIGPVVYIFCDRSELPDPYKLYAESFRGSDHLRRIQEEAQAIISRALARAIG